MIENGRGFNSSVESPSADKKDKDEKAPKDSKSKTGLESRIPAQREAEAKKIAPLLEKSPLFAVPETDEKTDRDAKTEVHETDGEFEPEDNEYLKQLSPEAIASETIEDGVNELEETPVRQTIASEHKKHPVVGPEPAPAVQEFLELVEEGVPNDEAEQTVSERHDLDLTTEDLPAVNDTTEESPEPTKPTSEMIATDEESEGEFDLGGSTEDEEADDPAAAGSGVGGSGGATPPPAGGGNAGGGTPPPPSPGPGGPGGGPPPPFGPAGFNANRLAAAAPSPNVIAVPTALEMERRAHNSGLLVGGIVGYLIGRRRGRIKTQKKLLPVQKKLEKQVHGLERELEDREWRLQRASIEKKQLQRQFARPDRDPAAEPQRSVENTQPRRPETPSPQSRMLNSVERTQPGRRETRLGLEKPAPAERLGHMIVAAQAPEKAEAVRMERPNNIRQAFRPEEVKDMRRNELLELSEKIVVEGASLRRVYESHLIGERQLRHLVSEYLRGKDIRHELRHEMVEREIDFERDPILRDRVRTNLASGASLNQLLAKAGALPASEDDEQMKRYKAESAKKAAQEQGKNRRRQATDMSLGAIIAVLLAVVAYLLIR